MRGCTPWPQVDKPTSDTVCPANGKKLRMKDLIPVRFTPVPEGAEGQFMDPLTKDTLTNHSKLVCIKTSGDVLLKETYERLVKPDGVYDGAWAAGVRDSLRLLLGGCLERSGRAGRAPHDARLSNRALLEHSWSSAATPIPLRTSIPLRTPTPQRTPMRSPVHSSAPYTRSLYTHCV